MKKLLFILFIGLIAACSSDPDYTEEVKDNISYVTSQMFSNGTSITLNTYSNVGITRAYTEDDTIEAYFYVNKDGIWKDGKIAGDAKNYYPNSGCKGHADVNKGKFIFKGFQFGTVDGKDNMLYFNNDPKYNIIYPLLVETPDVSSFGIPDYSPNEYTVTWYTIKETWENGNHFHVDGIVKQNTNVTLNIPLDGIQTIEADDFAIRKDGIYEELNITVPDKHAYNREKIGGIVNDNLTITINDISNLTWGGVGEYTYEMYIWPVDGTDWSEARISNESYPTVPEGYEIDYDIYKGFQSKSVPYLKVSIHIRKK